MHTTVLGQCDHASWGQRSTHHLSQCVKYKEKCRVGKRWCLRQHRVMLAGGLVEGSARLLHRAVGSSHWAMVQCLTPTGAHVVVLHGVEARRRAARRHSCPQQRFQAGDQRRNFVSRMPACTAPSTDGCQSLCTAWLYKGTPQVYTYASSIDIAVRCKTHPGV